MRIITVSGNTGSGKSHLADTIHDYESCNFHGLYVKTMGFGDRLKDECASLLNLYWYDVDELYEHLTTIMPLGRAYELYNAIALNKGLGCQEGDWNSIRTMFDVPGEVKNEILRPLMKAMADYYRHRNPYHYALALWEKVAKSSRSIDVLVLHDLRYEEEKSLLKANVPDLCMVKVEGGIEGFHSSDTQWKTWDYDKVFDNHDQDYGFDFQVIKWWQEITK